MNARFVVLSLGAEHAQTARAWLALLSLAAWAPAGSELVVVTDHPERFAWFGDRLRCLTVDAATIAAWQGRHRFFWRIKLEAMRLAAGRGSAHLVYVDADTLARRPLDDLVAGLAEGAVLMHQFEFDVARSRRSGDRRLWRQVRTLLPPPCPMWNAGVVALGAAQLDLLDEALVCCDRLLDAGVRHTLTEQLATSVTLAATGRLAPAAPWIDHYWGNKPAYDRAIDRFLAEALIAGDDPKAAAERLRREPILLPCVVRRRRWQRLAARWLGLEPREA